MLTDRLRRVYIRCHNNTTCKRSKHFYSYSACFTSSAMSYGINLKKNASNIIALSGSCDIDPGQGEIHFNTTPTGRGRTKNTCRYQVTPGFGDKICVTSTAWLPVIIGHITLFAPPTQPAKHHLKGD